MMDMTPPPGFEWGRFQNKKGAHIRYGHVRPEGESRGTVVLVGGFRESIEKYFETARDFLNQGLEVWMMDWRGQGGSSRYLPHEPQKSHHEGYDEQIATLHQFTQDIVQKNDKPLFLAAHSMGANIGLRYLKEHDGVFTAAIMTSPMTDIHTNGIPGWLARQWVKVAGALNALGNYAPGSKPWTHDAFANNDRTTDRERFNAWMNFLDTRPDLQMGGPTYGWLHHTFESIRVLNQEDYLKSIKTPILVGMTSNDGVVISDTLVRATSLLPDCKVVDFPAAKHEIWMERDDIRSAWLKEAVSFINAYITPSSSPQQKNGRGNNPPGPKK